MGIILNPIGYRIGYKQSWIDAWYVHRSNYSVFIHNILNLKLLINFLFFRYVHLKRSFWVFSNMNIYIFNNNIYANIYIYDAHSTQIYYSATRKFRKIFWKRLRMYSNWFKMQLMDRKKKFKTIFSIYKNNKIFLWCFSIWKYEYCI